MSSMLETLLKSYARYCPIDKGKYRLIESCWRHAVKGEMPIRDARLRHGNFTMRCDIGQALQRQFYFFGTYHLEKANLVIWEELSSAADVIFDVGANLGIYSLASAASNPSAAIFAFEPTPEIAWHLRETISNNQIESITILEQAVSDRTGEAVLNLWGSDEEGNEGLNFVSSQPVAETTQRVETISLDDFCERHGIEQIDLLKLDIQGNEANALRGASRLLDQNRINHIFVELNWSDDRQNSCPASETIEILDQHGYLFRLPELNSSPQPPGQWLRNQPDVVAVSTKD